MLGLFLFVYLIVKNDPQKIWTAMMQIKARPLLVLPFIMIIVFALQTLKWKIILLQQGARISFKTLFPVNLIGFFYGTITPGRMGTLLKMSYLKERTDIPLAACGTSILLDKFLDAVTLLFLALVGTYMIIGKMTGLFVSFVFVFVFLTAMFLLNYRKQRSRYLVELFLKTAFPQYFESRLRQSVELFFDALPRKRRLAVPLILSGLTWVLVFTQSYTIACALDIPLSYLTFLFVIPVGSAIGLLPITVGGLGTREATYVTLFLLYGISPQKVMSMSLINIFICSLIPAFIGWMVSLRAINR